MTSTFLPASQHATFNSSSALTMSPLLLKVVFGYSTALGLFIVAAPRDLEVDTQLSAPSAASTQSSAYHESQAEIFVKQLPKTLYAVPIKTQFNHRVPEPTGTLPSFQRCMALKTSVPTPSS
ncbi:hypothetical protein P171DRAFT_428350 [Karstenula rhodostoma CBS 690.94]|uniref:Uncharacterized protein n=1 Tax=Karstenula rhodostoma CBS 690.94 TaxID=1392251 RepID=A0A9P4PRY6_9PLEO|nr:hypothetical protein P171DRAFT_428350 [Karstenula rhodostoma CBS 690.94]